MTLSATVKNNKITHSWTPAPGFKGQHIRGKLTRPDMILQWSVALIAFLTAVHLDFGCCWPGPGPVVTLSNGTLQGQRVTVRGTEKVIQQYLGVPFARPPVGPLRFSAPQPPLAWDGVRNATNPPPMCPQDSSIIISVTEMMGINYTVPRISEDCLYLNIFTPSDPPAADKLPVMVWIHGGGLVWGAASIYDASALAAYQNVVVVTIQYRLSILGFLSTGDDHLKGNWGFLDQIAALHWVQENIDKFGGDPTSVTLFGESIGGISTSLQVLSPLATGLFHRAVLQSGVALVEMFLVKDPVSGAKAVANITECDFDTSEKFVQCLREKPMEVFITGKEIQYGAVVDGHFLKKPVKELFKTQAFAKVPTMLGVTNHEFGWMLSKVFFKFPWEDGLDRETFLTKMNDIFPEGRKTGINDAIADEYLQGAQTPSDVRDAFLEMNGDLFMVLPTIEVASYHRDAGAPTYLFEFQHRPQIYKDKKPSFVKADHGDDILYVFGACFLEESSKILEEISEEEDELCRTAMSYWGNFARTGSPNGPGLVEWPLFDKSEAYLNLGLKQTAGHRLRGNRVHFFTVTLPQKVQEKSATP